MSDPAAEREYREPPPPDKLRIRYFPSLDIEKIVRAKISRSWFRLTPDIYANTFYAGRNARFTPASWEFPCAYFAETPTTCFAEIYGDRIARHAMDGSGTPFVIPAFFAAATGLYELVDAPALRLCDLTDERTLLSLGLDLGTVYARDLSVTQRWAEAIARMGKDFDGLRYRSRHTSKLCQVLWNRPGAEALSERIAIERRQPLLDAPFAWEVAAMVGARLSFAAGFGS